MNANEMKWMNESDQQKRRKTQVNWSQPGSSNFHLVIVGSSAKQDQEAGEREREREREREGERESE